MKKTTLYRILTAAFGWLLVLGLSVPGAAAPQVSLTADPPPTAAAWNLVGYQAEDYLGYNLQPAGDINADGFDDVIMGAFLADADGLENNGAAYVFYGAPDGLPQPTLAQPVVDPDWVYVGIQSDESAGAPVSSAGDVNGDGYADVIIGASGYDVNAPATLTDAGRVVVFYGSAAGLGDTPDWESFGAQAGARYGTAVASAGDVNHDGYDDVLISSLYYDNGEQDEGRVFLFYGSADGLGTSAGWTAESDQGASRFGIMVNGVGDVNGDECADLIIGAEDYTNGENLEGAAFVWYGSLDGMGDPGTPANADWMAENNQAGDSGSSRYFAHFGGTPGDVNGDGYSDVILGNWEYNDPTFAAGAVFVWHGSPAGLGENGHPGNADWQASSGGWGYGYGTVLGKPADLNQDGYGDVVVGCLFCYGQPGSVYAYFGSAAGLGDPGTLNNADWSVAGPTGAAYTNSQFGWRAGGFGDLNGDRREDVLVSARFYPYDVASGAGENGAVYAYYATTSCYARLNGGFPIYHTLQAAVEASTSALDVIQIAGECSDLVEVHGEQQVVYLDKSLTLEGGYAPADWSGPDPVANPTVIDANYGGRGIQIVDGADPTIAGLTIKNGQRIGGDATGGGINIESASATIQNCRLIENTADHGGGVGGYHATVQILDSTFEGNAAQSGGAAAFRESSGELSSSSFLNNWAGSAAGGVELYAANVDLTGNLFMGNRADEHGGGLALHDSDTVLIGNMIRGNTAELFGGALSMSGGAPQLVNNLIIENRLIAAGGIGSGIALDGAQLTLLHNTIVGNFGGAGTGVFVDDGTMPVSSLTGTNNILVDHTTGLYVEAGASAVLEATFWGSGTWANTTDTAGAGAIDIGTINLWQVPGFVDADNQDYHLLPESAAVDAGVDAGVTADFEGTLRPSRAGFDIGADEVPDDPIVDLAVLSVGKTVFGYTVTFTAGVSDGTAVQYEWDFGDGGTASGQTVTHTFPGPGGYVVTLRGWNTVSEQQVVEHLNLIPDLFLPMTMGR